MGSFRFRAVSVRASGILALAMLGLIAACGDDDADDSTQGAEPARIAVLSAFPAELAEVLERTRVEDTVEVAGRTVRLGTLGGKPVAVAMTGIGLVNAANTRARSSNSPDPRVGGVAGSSLNIADVADDLSLRRQRVPATRAIPVSPSRSPTPATSASNTARSRRRSPRIRCACPIRRCSSSAARAQATIPSMAAHSRVTWARATSTAVIPRSRPAARSLDPVAPPAHKPTRR
jgi:hypothetical protein